MIKSFKQVRMLAFAAVVLMQTTANAHNAVQHKNTDAGCNFIPENSLRIPVGMERNGGLTEKQFNKVIDTVAKVYAPIIKAKGGSLKVNRLWTDDTVNASAQRQQKTWIVNMYGGLARHSVTSEDGFALVLCHELGHHLGGFPKVAGIFSPNAWASNEGQSDYFATMKCFRKVYENADNAAVLENQNIPETVKTKCTATFKSQKEINLCMRESMGGYNLALLLWNLSNSDPAIQAPKNKPEFDTPNTSAVSRTDHRHPEAQCRLDTYFAGSICGMHHSEEFSDKEPTAGACAKEKGDRFGTRPLCWYKPTR